MSRNDASRSNRSLRLIILLYSVFLLIVCSLAIYYSYNERINMYITEFDNTAELLEKEYDDILENFWKIYMPLFEEDNSNFQILHNYFFGDSTPNPSEKKALANVLKQMMLRDSRIRWLAIYRAESSENYILFSSSDTLIQIDESFPYWEHMINKSSQLEVYDARSVYDGEYTIKTFAVSGGGVTTYSNGSIIAGYDISCFSQYCNLHTDDQICADYVIQNTFGTVFNSGTTGAFDAYTPADNQAHVVTMSNQEKYYTKALTNAGRLSFNVTYFTSWWPLFLHSASTTILITTLFIVFSLLALILYLKELKNMSKQIEKTTLAEIQSKFNPHFLYNYLEALREKIYSSGDYESSDTLVTLSSIFRRLVSGENFVSIRDEITFCDMYISLFKSYYANDLDVIYDIENEVLDYGIIRNLLQPLVENYFIHGFDRCESSRHYISIKGSIIENRYVVITYEDNGLGMSPDQLDRLRQQFSSSSSVNSYGLKSIYQRIKLFYGKDCGIEIASNYPHGLIIQVKIKKMTLEEHNVKLHN